MHRFPFMLAAVGMALGLGSAALADTSPPSAGGAIVVVQAPPITPDARSLLGRPVRNPQGETIGEIKSVHLGPAGDVEKVIVGVGDYLGLGARDIALPWNGLTDNGVAVTVNATKRTLSAMPAYRYPDPVYRGTVFRDPQPVPEP